MKTLTEIIEHWLTTDPDLEHWRIYRSGYTWLTCDCIDHAWSDLPSFSINEDSVTVIMSGWTKEHIAAADPDFFSKLHQKLVALCKEKRGPLRIN